MRRSCALTALALLWVAPAALADSSSSSNWAGYAAHLSRGRFHRVVASWTEPAVTCTPGQRTYSAFWIGLGGYSVTSKAIEQVGTEADCRVSGKPKMEAWYEIVPAPSRTFRLAVHAGDRISASVEVTGRLVRLTLSDLTTRRSATRHVLASRVDLSSAEWIAEAPSDCINGGNACTTLPLANFGSATFQHARAQLSDAGMSGISSRHWSLTRIALRPSHRGFVGLHPGAAAGEATPSALADSDTAFTVTYSALTLPGTPPGVPPGASTDVASSHLFH